MQLTRQILARSLCAVLSKALLICSISYLRRLCRETLRDAVGSLYPVILGNMRIYGYFDMLKIREKSLICVKKM